MRSPPTLASNYEWIQVSRSRGSEENEIIFFKNILVSNSPVTENLIGSGPSPSPQQMDALKTLSYIREDAIVKWLATVLKAGSGDNVES